MLTYSASQLWSVLHGMTRSVCRVEASVYTTLKTTGIIAVRPTHRGTKRPANWPMPVLTSSAPRRCVYKQTGHRGSNVNNLIQMSTNRWDFPSILCANARSVTNKIDELDAECQNKCIDVAGITETWLKMTSPRSPYSSVASTLRSETIATADAAEVWRATCDRAYNINTGRSCMSSVLRLCG